MQDTLHSNARSKLISGITKVRDAVAATLGTGGSNAIIEAIERPGHLVTNDGITIAQSIHLVDPIENMGKNILLEAISRANKESGDGSTTTTILTAAIIEEGQKHLDKMTPMELKKSLEDCLPAIEESLLAQTRTITVDEVGQVAAISAEDAEIGARIQEIYKIIGSDGIIHWDISKSYEDSYTIGEGITIDGTSLLSPFMADMDNSGQFQKVSRIKSARVILTRQKINSIEDIAGICEQLYRAGTHEVVFFADEVEPLVLASAMKTRFREEKPFRIIILKMPTLWKDWWYEDLAKVTGATVIDSVAIKLKETKLEHVGSVDNLVISKTETHIDGIKDVTGHIKALEEDGSDDALLRISRLNTKTARYFVGAASESALSYRRLKVEDAISAAYQALHGGIVLGGGRALVKVANSLENTILKTALMEPYAQICENMGGKLFTDEDMEAQKVFDPAPVVRNAVRNALSVAATVLTADTIVTLPREDKKV